MALAPTTSRLALFWSLLLAGANTRHITCCISGFTYRDATAKAGRDRSSSPITSSVEFPLSDDVVPTHSLPTLFWSKYARSTIFNKRYCCLVLHASNTGGTFCIFIITFSYPGVCTIRNFETDHILHCLFYRWKHR